MKIAIFGATGGTGRQVVKQALAAGHEVTALARDPSQLDVSDPNLTVVAGSVLDAAPVQQVLQGADAAVVSLGNTANNPFKMLMKTALRKPMEDKERQEAMVKASGLDWTIVRPGGLTNGPATGQYKSGLDPKISAGQVARADVAAFVLLQLTDDTYVLKAPAIT